MPRKSKAEKAGAEVEATEPVKAAKSGFGESHSYEHLKLASQALLPCVANAFSDKCFLLKQGYLCAFGAKQSAKVRTVIADEIEAAVGVDAKAFTSFLKSVPSDADIRFQIMNDRVQLKAGRAKVDLAAQVMSERSDPFAAFENLPMAEITNPLDWLALLSLAATVADTKTDIKSLPFVWITEAGEAFATDHFNAAKVIVPSFTKKTIRLSVPAIEFLQKHTQNKLEAVCNDSGSLIVFRINDGEAWFMTSMPEHNCPNIGHIFDTADKNIQFSVPMTQDMRVALKRHQAMQSDLGAENMIVTITISNKSLSIATKTPTANCEDVIDYDRANNGSCEGGDVTFKLNPSYLLKSEFPQFNISRYENKINDRVTLVTECAFVTDDETYALILGSNCWEKK